MNVNDIQWNAPRPYERQAHFAPDRMAGTVPVWEQTTTQKSSQAPALSLAGVQEVKPVIPPTLSFGEVLDIINPLQHIPVINHAYRGLTGDDLSPVAKIAGGSLYGGPIGGVVSLLNAASQEHSGTDLTSALWAKASSNHNEKTALADKLSYNIYRLND